MYQTANEPIQYKKRPLYRQTARKPRIKHGSSLSPVPAALDKNQGGRVRSWLTRNAGLSCIAVGWALAFVLLVIPKTADFATAIVEIGVFGAAFFGFGLGWIVRGEGGKR